MEVRNMSQKTDCARKNILMKTKNEAALRIYAIQKTQPKGQDLI